MLKTVRKPSSLRMGPTYFMAEWYFWAKRKLMPQPASSARTFSGSCCRFTPRASRQSAVPDLELAARLPCLVTLAPAAAQMRAAVVEMLKVLERSPPVPTISSVSMPGCSTGVASSRMAVAQPEISSMVSARVFLVERAARKAAFWVGVVWPLMISLMVV